MLNNNHKSNWKIKIGTGTLFLLLFACVDRLDFTSSPNDQRIIVEGMISDQPGPYTVKISRSLSLNADTLIQDPVQNAVVTLNDDEGNSEVLFESIPGIYLTDSVIQGKIGHSYFIQIETDDGKKFESEPDMIKPGGEVQDVRFEYEARSIEMNYGVVDANIFNVYIDADIPPATGDDSESYVRWRYTGTYKVVTHPEQHQTFLSGFYYRTPLPCSGYVIEPALGGGTLRKVSDCTCCECWANLYESIPHLSDRQFISGNRFSNVKVAEVPVNSNTFTEKFMVEVEQMSLTKQTFKFFQTIQTQKEGATSLFQPPYSELKGNIKSTNSDAQVLGLFWASSVRSKYVFIQRSDVPYKLTPPDFVLDACTIFPNSSTTKPAFWE